MDFVAAPAKRKPKAAAAAPKKTIVKGARLTVTQKAQLAKYSSKANKGALRLYMLRQPSMTVQQAVRAIAERRKREVAPVKRPKRPSNSKAGRKFIDDMAQ